MGKKLWIGVAALLLVLLVRTADERATRAALPVAAALRVTAPEANVGAKAAEPAAAVVPPPASVPGEASAVAPVQAVVGMTSAPEAEAAATLKVRGERPYDRRHPLMARAIEVQERHADLMANPGVIGTAVGLKAEGEPAILVYTRADGVDLPAALEGIPVVEKRRDGFEARQQGPARTRDDVKTRAGETSNAQRWERAVPIGVSAGHPAITAGTIGCRVKGADGRIYALSNNHVLANSNAASIGDRTIQPGPYDGGSSPGDDIGTLHAFEPIQFGGSPHRPKNLMDAAIALSTAAQLGNATPHTGGYGVPSSETVPPAVGMKVTKVGRTTGHTSGTIDAINAMVSVNYGTGQAHFKSQVVIVPGSFSAGGDSGSLIVTNDGANRPVGLLFAGSSADTIANEIRPVLQRFGVTVDDTPGTTNAAPVVSITSPAPGATFSSGSEIAFAGSAADEDGDLSGSLVWTDGEGNTIGTGASFSATLADGTRTITATATDSGGLAGSASVTIRIGNTPVVGVSSVAYGTTGPRGRDLLIVVALSPALSGASVSVATSTGGTTATGTALTGADGTATFKWKNAPSGTYTTQVTDVTATGYAWDGATPENGFTK